MKYTHRTVQQHYMEAEKLLSHAENTDTATLRDRFIAQAQVHATLATVPMDRRNGSNIPAVMPDDLMKTSTPARARDYDKLGEDPNMWVGP